MTNQQLVRVQTGTLGRFMLSLSTCALSSRCSRCAFVRHTRCNMCEPNGVS